MGPNTPFFTKEDAIGLMERQNQNHEWNKVQFQQILDRLNSQSENMHNENTKNNQSPPRKNQRTTNSAATREHNEALLHDQIMTEVQHEEVGKE